MTYTDGRVLSRTHQRRIKSGIRRPSCMTLAGRLMSFVSKQENGCWLWTGATSSAGYGQLWVRSEGTHRAAHRVSWELHRGAVPDGLQLDHLCRNRACVNPDHLEPVTRRENQRRGNGWAGENARKTHCKRGHEFTPENTLLAGNGRNCIACAHMHSLARSRGGMEDVA